MSRVTRAVPGAIRRLERVLFALRAQLTPGQRWTSALALGLAVALLLFGMPTRVDTRIRRPAAQPARAARAQAAQAAPAAPAAPAAAVGPAPAGAGLLAPLPDAAGPAAPLDGAVTPPAPEQMNVVALATTGGALPGRDDAAIAAVFAPRAGVPVRVVTHAGADNAATCRATLAAGSVVIASGELPIELRRCLLAGGARLVAFDGRADDAAAGGGALVSTRRTLEDTLVDLGRWGRATGALRGRVGLVSVAGARPAAEQAVDALRALGLDIAATAFVGDEPTAAADVQDGVRRFVAAGVAAVVFAAPVDVQRRWGAQHALLSPSTRFVVSDAFDGVRDERYPPVFDGALAHTSLRIPWYARTHGETPQQKACREAWESQGRTMIESERLPVYAWCQHVALVGAAVAQARVAGGTFLDALRAVRLPSPLTSDLGPLDAAGYGPTEDAVLVWRTACGCWQQQRELAPRTTT